MQHFFEIVWLIAEILRCCT